MDGKKIRISLIEDSLIHREWLQLELSSDDRFDLISVDEFGRKGLISVKTHIPDIVLLDFQLEDITGLEVAKRIKSYDAGIKIFSITAHTDASIIEWIIQDKHIDAIAIKGSPYFEENFLSAIIQVANGENYLDPSLLKKIRQGSKENSLKQLTRRELEVFIQLGSGKKDEEIAKDLCVEMSHVRNLKSRIAKKADMGQLGELLKKLVSNLN